MVVVVPLFTLMFLTYLPYTLCMYEATHHWHVEIPLISAFMHTQFWQFSFIDASHVSSLFCLTHVIATFPASFQTLNCVSGVASRHSFSFVFLTFAYGNYSTNGEYLKWFAVFVLDGCLKRFRPWMWWQMWYLFKDNATRVLNIFLTLLNS